MKVSYRIHDISGYIHWIYFFHAWQFPPRFAAVADMQGCAGCRMAWLNGFPEQERAKAAEAARLYDEARRLLDESDADFCARGIFRLAEANSEGDDLLLDGVRFPLLRQQAAKAGEPYLCLSDFVRPASSRTADKVGVFATTVDAGMEQMHAGDGYRRMLAQTLADRLAEAAAEKLHEEVRKKAWGYAPGEHLSVKDLHDGRFCGIRPAVGYPSLPDQSVNFLLDDLLDMKQIGITLTENGMMRPHASVSGLMFAHPAARYFSVGKIGSDQLADYAARRGMPVSRMRQFLAANL